MGLTERQKEAIAGYRKYFPEKCKDLDDYGVMVIRNLMTPGQADMARLKDKKKEEAKILTNKNKEPRKTSTVKVRPYTYKQYRKLCDDIRNDTQADMKELFESENGEGWWDSACWDIAEGLLKYPSDERLVAYFKKSGIDKQFWIEAFACDIHG